eukprot:GHVS01079202.1.p3 GENE.GHVS01079202.1~~GHVS01079202.1.p3  ORF type:complete len:119 (-),score=24.37 GHVS01079202.1:1252-1608(-)
MDCICEVLYSLMNGVQQALRHGDLNDIQSDLGTSQSLNEVVGDQEHIENGGGGFLGGGTGGVQMVALMVLVLLAAMSLFQNHRVGGGVLPDRSMSKSSYPRRNDRQGRDGDDSPGPVA